MMNNDNLRGIKREQFKAIVDGHQGTFTMRGIITSVDAIRNLVTIDVEGGDPWSNSVQLENNQRQGSTYTTFVARIPSSSGEAVIPTVGARVIVHFTRGIFLPTIQTYELLPPQDDQNDNNLTTISGNNTRRKVITGANVTIQGEAATGPDQAQAPRNPGASNPNAVQNLGPGTITQAAGQNLIVISPSQIFNTSTQQSTISGNLEQYLAGTAAPEMTVKPAATQEPLAKTEGVTPSVEVIEPPKDVNFYYSIPPLIDKLAQYEIDAYNKLKNDSGNTSFNTFVKDFEYTNLVKNSTPISTTSSLEFINSLDSVESLGSKLASSFNIAIKNSIVITQVLSALGGLDFLRNNFLKTNSSPTPDAPGSLHAVVSLIAAIRISLLEHLPNAYFLENQITIPFIENSKVNVPNYFCLPKALATSKNDYESLKYFVVFDSYTKLNLQNFKDLQINGAHDPLSEIIDKTTELSFKQENGSEVEVQHDLYKISNISCIGTDNTSVFSEFKSEIKFNEYESEKEISVDEQELWLRSCWISQATTLLQEIYACLADFYSSTFEFQNLKPLKSLITKKLEIPGVSSSFKITPLDVHFVVYLMLRLFPQNGSEAIQRTISREFLSTVSDKDKQAQSLNSWQSIVDKHISTEQSNTWLTTLKKRTNTVLYLLDSYGLLGER